jgi:hypothetical protein
MEHVVIFVLCKNAVADSVMLYLQHDFYNKVVKVKHKLYLASGSTPHQGKILGVHLGSVTSFLSECIKQPILHLSQLC